MAKVKLITSMLIFGTIGIFVKYVPYPSSLIALVRGIIGVLFLIAAMGFMKHPISLKALKKNWLLLLLSGIAIGANWICLFEAYRYTTVSVATLCYYMAPIFVILLSPIVLKERLTWVKAICILLAFIGIGLVSGVNSDFDLLNDSKGILYGLSAAVLYCSIILMNKFIKEISPMESTTLQLGISALVLFPYTLITGSTVSLDFNWKIGILLLVLGIIHTGLAYFFYFSSIPQLEGQTVAIYSYIDPIVAIILSGFILQEQITVIQIFGAILILGAAFLSDIT
jgi:drug/metabolite transporter (DMT)-like permease